MGQEPIVPSHRRQVSNDRRGFGPVPKRRRPCQPHPGTRIIRYRCSLPGLAEFTNYRRGGTDRATIRRGRGTYSLVPMFAPMRDRRAFETGGEGGIRTRDTGISRIHTFQACSFNHSDTSPHAKPLLRPSTPGGMVRPLLGLTPRSRSGPTSGCPNSFQTNLSNPRRYGDKPYTHFPGALLQPLGHLSAMVKPACRAPGPGKEAKG